MKAVTSDEDNTFSFYSLQWTKSYCFKDYTGIDLEEWECIIR